MKAFRSATGLLRPIQNHFRISTVTRSTFRTDSLVRPAFTRLPVDRPWIPSLHYSTGRSLADTLAEELQQIYAEAKDEFEIASESTEAHAIYAAEDRQAARDELVKLQEAYQKALEGEAGEELRKRPIGQRVRELEAAIENLNKADYEE